MPRLSLRHPASLLALLPLLIPALALADATGPAGSDQHSSDQEYLICPADHPLVQLLQKARKAAVYVGTGLLTGPDEEGNYRVGNAEDVRSIRVYTYSSRQLGLLTADDISAIAEHFPHIESLHFPRESAAPLWVPELKRFANLKELQVRLTLPRIEPDTNSDAPAWTPELHKQVSATVFDQLSHLPNIERLDLNCEYREESIKKLAYLKNLRELHLTHFERCSSTYDDNYVAPNNDFSAETWSRTLGRLPHLEIVDMNQCELRGPIDWQALAGLSNLHTLLLSESGLSDEQLAGIEQLAHLEELDLSNNPITGKSLTRIGQLKSLETLGLGETNVSDNSLALADLPNLDRVDYPGGAFAERRLSTAELELVIRTCTRDTVAVEDPEAIPLARIEKLFPGGIESLSISDAKGAPSIRLVGPSGQNRSHRLTRVLVLRHRPLTRRDLEEIEQLTHTRYLTVTTSPESPVDGEIIASLLQMPVLEYLGLNLGSLTRNAAVLPLLARHPTLQRLQLTNALLDADAASHLASIPNLHSLNISDGQVHSAAWPVLAQAKNLESLSFSLGRDMIIEGHPGERFRGIGKIKSLKSLSAGSRVGNDHECRWIGQCRSLENLSLCGTFSNVGLARLTPMPDLKRLTLGGTVTVTEDGLAVLGRNPQLEWAAITNTDGNPEKNVYSEAISREHEIGFAGACSCGCMDIEPPGALVLKRDQFTLQDDRLVVRPSVAANLDLTREETDKPWNGKLRITTPIRRDALRIDCADLPRRLTHLYLNDVHVDRLDLVNCLQLEIGVFGNSRVRSLNIHESRDHDPGRYADAHHPGVGISLYLGGVQRLTVHSARTLTGLSLCACRGLQSLRLEGSFPRLASLRIPGAPHLEYLAAPDSGSAPKLQISFHRREPLPHLRLLTAPGVANAGIGSLLSDSLAHPPLHEVDVRRSGIEDKGLDLLATVPTLRILRIAGCADLTPQGIARFKSARPEVAVVQAE